jgi:ADP-heptose:LPS heptosyltransferase
VFFSLQACPPKDDGPQISAFPQLIQLDGRLTDFAATASVIGKLDLVITVDTAVAHLAGALGRPVWTLLQHSPDWRWPVRWAERTPWYPTMRLFRQTKRGDWASVIRRVADELVTFVAATHP